MTIINIETSGEPCSAALTAEGNILFHQEVYEGHQHATALSDLIKACLDTAKAKDLKIDAIAVSIGPGSYTGLRIGLSEAKGLAYALDVPLIGVSTLKLLATTVMFDYPDLDGSEIFVPMIDARRMEVYTAVYDMSLDTLMPPCAMVLEEGCFGDRLAGCDKILYFGSGAEKAAPVMPDAAEFIPDIKPLAKNMTALSDTAFLKGEFLDLAYSVPVYLKEFQGSKPKRSLF